MDALLVDINQAGLGRGLQFELFRPAAAEIMRDFYAELPITVKVTGNYHDMGAFASDVGQALAHRDAERRRDRPPARTAVLAMDAVARTFRYLDDDEVAAQQRKRGGQGKGRRRNEALSHRRSRSRCALCSRCGGEEHGDLKQELAQLTKDFRGQVPPLPQVKPYEPVPYTAEGQIDPFRPQRIDVAAAQASAPSASKCAHEKRDRPKEPLEAFPLESIQMLGTITQDKETFALVKAGPNLYRVQKGNYMGQNFGVITGIDESADQAERARAGRRRRMGGAEQRACNWWRDKKMNNSESSSLVQLAFSLLALRRSWRWAQAQANAIEGVRRHRSRAARSSCASRTKEPLRSVPPNFAVANPARIAFDFPNTANGLGRSSQDIGQGELRSMNVVQGADRTRLVLNLRRPVPHESDASKAAAGRSRCREAAAGADRARRPGGAASPKAAPTPSTQIRDVDFRRGRARRRPGRGRSLRYHHRHRHPHAGPEHRGRVPQDRAARATCAAASTWSTSARRSTPSSTFQQGENVRMVIEPTRPVGAQRLPVGHAVRARSEAGRRGSHRACSQRGRYTGEKLSLNFQNVEVRAVLQRDRRLHRPQHHHQRHRHRQHHAAAEGRAVGPGARDHPADARPRQPQAAAT